jgi:hypothetical protein
MHEYLKIFDIAIENWEKYALFQIFLITISVVEILSIDVAMKIFNLTFMTNILK